MTCCSLTNSLSKSIKALKAWLKALVSANTVDVTRLKAANLLTASADCLPNSSISVRNCVTPPPPPPPAPPPAAALAFAPNC